MNPFKIGEIQISHYRGLVPNLDTNEVVITERQKRHSNERHHGDFDAYHDFIPEILEAPDGILEDLKHPTNTVNLVKAFSVGTERLYFYLVLRLHTPEEPSEYRNSIITFWRIHQKEYERLLRNRKRYK